MEEEKGSIPSINTLLLICLAINVAILSAVLFYYQNNEPSTPEETPFKMWKNKISSPNIEKGSTLRLRINISNFGNSRGTKKLVLKSNDKTLGKKNISLEPNETQTVDFNLQNLDIGTHEIKIGNLKSDYKVSKRADCPPPQISIDPLKNIGKIYIDHEGGRTLKNIINQEGKLENISITKNGIKINKSAKLIGDGDSNLEPGEKLEIMDNTLSPGDRIKVQNPTSENVLKETFVPLESEFSRISLKELPERISKPSQEVSHYLKSNLENPEYKNVPFRFKVNKSWMSKTEITENNLSIKGYDPEKETWKSHPAEKTRENKDQLEFKSSSLNSKYFAITKAEDLGETPSTFRKYFPLIITVLTVLIVAVEIKILWNWLEGEENIIETLRDEKESGGLKLQSEDFEGLINEFANSGKNRAMIKTKLPTDKVLEYSQSAIENLEIEDNIKAEIVENRVHLIRKSE